MYIQMYIDKRGGYGASLRLATLVRYLFALFHSRPLCDSPVNWNEPDLHGVSG